MRFYNKYKKVIEYIIYPLSLLLLPLVNFNQGVDVSDSTYSLGNYLFADKLEGMWVISTYLSNVVGSIIMKLPGATTLRGANIYTGLVLSAIGIIVYFTLKDELDARYVFLGEFAAIAFCWIPTGILYNYLTYLMMAVGSLMLYKGINSDEWKYYLGAGVVLGLNVFVRIPNITQMALILSLWFVCFLTRKNCIRPTLICVSGYVVGIAIPGIAILIKYGISGIADMISGLSGITSTDETYTPLSMITAPIKAYGMSFKWIALIVFVVVCGCIMFAVLPDKLKKVKTAIYIGVIVLMLRFFWGRGMFSFRYYEDYTSMYEWGVIALYLSLIVDLVTIVSAVKESHFSSVVSGLDYSNESGVKSKSINNATMAVISLVVIMIAPLGSNNSLYQNINNLFLVMPFTVYVTFGWIRNAWEQKKCFSIPVAFMLYALLVCIMIQSFGFSQNFVFRDGMRGEKRDNRITGVPVLEGMYTNGANAKSLEGVYDYINTSCTEAGEVILFGDCPGLTYILEKPSALYSSWIDLDSNPIDQMKSELDAFKNKEENIPVIVRNIEGPAVSFKEKKALIDDYISEGGYSLGYENEYYKVFVR